MPPLPLAINQVYKDQSQTPSDMPQHTHVPPRPTDIPPPPVRCAVCGDGGKSFVGLIFHSKQIAVIEQVNRKGLRQTFSW